MFKTLFSASLFVTLVVNIMFLIATKDKPPDLSGPKDDGLNGTAPVQAQARTQAGKQTEDLEASIDRPREEANEEKVVRVSSCDGDPKMLHLRVKSSKDHVFVSANNLIIYESKSAAKRAKQEAPSLMANDKMPHQPHEELLIGATADDLANVVEEPDADAAADGRGVHVVVLNEFNGSVMAKRVFDTYSPGQEDELSSFISSVRDGRILVFAIKDEGSFRLANNSTGRYLLKKLGSQHIMQLGWRDMWAFVVQKNLQPSGGASFEGTLRGKQVNGRRGRIFGESLMKSSKFTSWAPAAILDLNLRLNGLTCEAEAAELDPTSLACNWSSGDEHADRRRLAFCSKIEGYAGVCDCDTPARIEFSPTKLPYSQLGEVPIVVMASNRPYYLYRMLGSLLAADGVNSSMVTVFIDGFYEGPLRVSQLFNLRTVQGAPLSTRSARISHHYKSSLAATFDRLFPAAEFAIIFEEDLLISRDIMVYFNRTLDLLKRDPSLYCSSAWNDQGYRHSTGPDAGLLYRIETMPGLGWMLSRKLFKEELEPHWPSADQPHDWDMWIRSQPIRRRRECIIPDISRTFHFGSIGTNINSYFQHQYFSQHAFFNGTSQQPATQFRDLDKLTEASYEEHIEQLLSEARCVVRTDQGPHKAAGDFLCPLAAQKWPPNEVDANETPTNNATSSVIFIDMIDEHDYVNWLKLAKCWRIWDLDARGQHKSMWRLHLLGKPLFVVGVPASPYAKFKPAHVEPFAL